MRRIYCGTGLLALALAASAYGVDKKKDASIDATNQDQIDKLALAGDLTGTVKSVGTGLLTVQVDQQTLQANPSAAAKGSKSANAAARHQAELLREQEQIMKTKNPLQRAHKLQQLVAKAERYRVQAALNPGQNPFKVVVTHKNYDLDVPADAVIRSMQPPDAYDDKGNPKKYTATELKQLKGDDPKLPGYTADFNNLKMGQVVKIHFGKKKDPVKAKDKDAAAKDKDAPKEKDVAAKDKDKDAAKDKDAEPKTHILMVVILKDADPAAADKKK